MNKRDQASICPAEHNNTHSRTPHATKSLLMPVYKKTFIVYWWKVTHFQRSDLFGQNEFHSPAAFTQSKIQVFDWMVLLMYSCSFHPNTILYTSTCIFYSLTPPPLLVSLSSFLQFLLRCFLLHLLQSFHGVELGLLGRWCFVPRCSLWSIPIIPVASSTWAARGAASWGSAPFALAFTARWTVQRLLTQSQRWRRF